MSDDEQPQFTSLKDRIAALHLKDGSPPISPGAKAAPPKPKPKPPVGAKPTPAAKPVLAPKPPVAGGRRTWPPPAQPESDEEANGQSERKQATAPKLAPILAPEPPAKPAVGARRAWPPTQRVSDEEVEGHVEPSRPIPPRPERKASGVRVWPPPAHADSDEEESKEEPAAPPKPAVIPTAPPKPCAKPVGGRRVWPPPAQDSDEEETRGKPVAPHKPATRPDAPPKRPVAPPKPAARKAWPPTPQADSDEDPETPIAAAPTGVRQPPPKPARRPGWSKPSPNDSDTAEQREKSEEAEEEPDVAQPAPRRAAPPKPAARPAWPPKPVEDESKKAPKPTGRKAWPPPPQTSSDGEDEATQEQTGQTEEPAPIVTRQAPPPPPGRPAWPPKPAHEGLEEEPHQSAGRRWSPAAQDESEEEIAEDVPAPAPASRSMPPPPPRRSPSTPANDEGTPAPTVRPPLPQRRSSGAQPAPTLPPRKDAPPLPRRQPSQASVTSPPPSNRRLPPVAPAISPSTTGHSAASTTSEPKKKPPPLPSSARPSIPTAPRPTPSKKPEEHDEEDEKPKKRFMVPLPPGGLEKPPPIVPKPSSDGPPPIAAGKPSSSGPPPVPTGSRPPPVPTGSRPKSTSANGYAYSAHAPKTVPGADTCLICRDYSAPDEVAASYPTASLPVSNRISYLADVLCSPFPSLTDKARAVFTWLHYNLQYDVPNFLAGTIPRGLNAEQTIQRGLAVCEGFADVFMAICQAAGLECRRISGFGKGYGFSPENAMASFDSNHAWNVVRLEGGWTLVDSCWGAGHIDNGVWVQQFNPSMFTMGNRQFGARHFPSNTEEWYGPARSWEAFLQEGEGGPQRYGTADQMGLALGEEAVGPWSTLQRGQRYDFWCKWMCPHWTSRPEFKPTMICLRVNGKIIRPHDDGQVISAQAVAEGEVTLSVIDKVNNVNAEGMTWAEFDAMPSKSYGMQHLYSWTVV